MAKTDEYLLRLDPPDRNRIGYYKEESFSYKLLHSPKQFEEWYDSSIEAYSPGDYIFRGSNEAKYKQYNSLQRAWWNFDFTRALFGDIGDPTPCYNFLEVLMKNARQWNHGVLEKYFRGLKTELNDLSLLSLMQHYGLPTPLLDFTYDLDIALFFSFSGMEVVRSNRIIDNCVSLYILGLTANKERISVLSDLHEEKDIKIKSILERKKLVLISEKNQEYFNEEGRIKTSIYSNLNIINQKGLFLLNYHHWKPIEARNEMFEGHPFLKEVICIDIHKSLKHFILRKLSKNKPYLNSEYLFPNFNNFRDVSLNDTFRDISLYIEN